MALLWLLYGSVVAAATIAASARTEAVLWLPCQPGENKRVCSCYGFPFSSSLLAFTLSSLGSANNMHSVIQEDHRPCWGECAHCLEREAVRDSWNDSDKLNANCKEGDSSSPWGDTDNEKESCFPLPFPCPLQMRSVSIRFQITQKAKVILSLKLRICCRWQGCLEVMLWTEPVDIRKDQEAALGSKKQRPARYQTQILLTSLATMNEATVFHRLDVGKVQSFNFHMSIMHLMPVTSY